MATLKIQSAEIEPFWATPEILFFLRMRFSNFFLNYMVWKYQNEIAPIFYYGISTKTNEKDIKIPKLQPPDWKSPYWMSLYYKKLNILSALINIYLNFKISTSSSQTIPFQFLYFLSRPNCVGQTSAKSFWSVSEGRGRR